MGCSGCGGRGKSPGGTFGHILGCGRPEPDANTPEPGKPGKKPRARWSSFGKPEQLGILKHALQDSGLDPKVADTFAQNLRGVLDEHYWDCNEAKPGDCKHCTAVT
jgi:hypothetical protein